MRALIISCFLVVCFGAIQTYNFNVWMGIPTEYEIQDKKIFQRFLQWSELKDPNFFYTCVPNLLCNLGDGEALDLVKDCFKKTLGTTFNTSTFPYKCGATQLEIFEMEREKFCGMDRSEQFRKSVRDYYEADEVVKIRQGNYDDLREAWMATAARESLGYLRIVIPITPRKGKSGLALLQFFLVCLRQITLQSSYVTQICGDTRFFIENLETA